MGTAPLPSSDVSLLTVGHGTLTEDAFLTLLRDASVDVLIDVRSYPGSRRNPQYGREAMERWVVDGGVEYRWEKAVGGRRKGIADSRHRALRHDAFRAYADHMETADFKAGLDRVLDVAADRRTAVMCSESVWWRCHRRLMADAAVLLRGAEVVHLFHDGRFQPHPVTPEARREGDDVVYDGGSSPLPLPL